MRHGCDDQAPTFLAPAASPAPTFLAPAASPAPTFLAPAASPAPTFLAAVAIREFSNAASYAKSSDTSAASPPPPESFTLRAPRADQIESRHRRRGLGL